MVLVSADGGSLHRSLPSPAGAVLARAGDPPRLGCLTGPLPAQNNRTHEKLAARHRALTEPENRTTKPQLVQ